MAFNYTLIVSETPPQNVAPGNTFWLKASQGVMQQYIIDGQFAQIGSGKGNLSISNGTYFRLVTQSATTPTSPSIGDIWLQNGDTYWVYLGKWTPFGGN